MNSSSTEVSIITVLPKVTGKIAVIKVVMNESLKNCETLAVPEEGVVGVLLKTLTSRMGKNVIGMIRSLQCPELRSQQCLCQYSGLGE